MNLWELSDEKIYQLWVYSVFFHTISSLLPSTLMTISLGPGYPGKQINLPDLFFFLALQEVQAGCIWCLLTPQVLVSKRAKETAENIKGRGRRGSGGDWEDRKYLGHS